MFLTVHRIYITDKNNQSVEYFKEEEYGGRKAMTLAAEKRFHNIIAADLQNESVVYQCAFIMDSTGGLVERPVVFDRSEDDD